MMFMMTMPPTPRDTEAMSSERMKAAGDLAPELLQALRGDDAERVGGAEGGVADGPQHRARLVDRVVHAGDAAAGLDVELSESWLPKLLR